MWVAVAALGADGGSLSAAPRFSLRAGESDAATVERFPVFVPVLLAGVSVAEVSYHDKDDDHADPHEIPIDDGVFLIAVRILKLDPARTWTLKIENAAIQSIEVTFVVADGEVPSHQPWIDMTRASLEFDAVVGQTKTVSVQIRNRGTGSLRISDVAGQQLGNGFSLLEVPGPIAPGRTGELDCSSLHRALPCLSPPRTTTPRATTRPLSSRPATAAGSPSARPSATSRTGGSSSPPPWPLRRAGY